MDALAQRHHKRRRRHIKATKAANAHHEGVVDDGRVLWLQNMAYQASALPASTHVPSLHSSCSPQGSSTGWPDAEQRRTEW